MTDSSFHTPLPSISSSLPFTRQPLDSSYPPWSVSPAPAFYSSSFDLVSSPPLDYQQEPRASPPPPVSYNHTHTPPPSYLVPLRVPSLEDSSPPPPAWTRLAASYSPNSTSGSRSPLRTPRESLYGYDFAPQLPSEPWQPKPRVWSEQPLFDEPARDSVSPPRMQSYHHHPPAPPQPQMMPMMGSSLGHGEYVPPPPTFGGGLGAAFPELLPPQQPSGYDSISHPSMMVGDSSDGYHFDPERPHVGAVEFAQALEAYQHIRASLPYIRPAADMYGPPATGQAYRSLVDCANTAIGMLSGQIPARQPGLPHHRPVGLAGPEAKRLRLGHADKDKPATYCRGCGATETPEWRRGPLGPRTLCNACGLVHMKMMRKKKKAEEKAAAAVAAAASNKGI